MGSHRFLSGISIDYLNRKSAIFDLPNGIVVDCFELHLERLYGFRYRSLIWKSDGRDLGREGLLGS
jgi:hypothetical protein